MDENKPLHHWLPSKIDNKLKGLTCQTCGNIIKKDNIIAVGVRSTDKDRNVMYIEYQCPNGRCGYRACKLFENKGVNSLEELCYFLLEEIQKRKKVDNAKEYTKSQSHRISNSKITDKEMAELREFMTGQSNHDEFLKFIGIPQKESRNES
jgi:hypothetical protein